MSLRWTLADFRGQTWTQSANVRVGVSAADVRGHSWTICRRRSRTVTADIRGLFTADICEHSWTATADIRGLLRRAVADFYRGPSRTFTADFRRRLFVVGSQRTVLCRLDTTTIQPLFHVCQVELHMRSTDYGFNGVTVRHPPISRPGFWDEKL